MSTTCPASFRSMSWVAGRVAGTPSPLTKRIRLSWYANISSIESEEVLRQAELRLEEDEKELREEEISLSVRITPWTTCNHFESIILSFFQTCIKIRNPCDHFPTCTTISSSQKHIFPLFLLGDIHVSSARRRSIGQRTDSGRAQN